MEIIAFSGGLGNQMFQYAFYLAKSKTSSDIAINTYSIYREGVKSGFELKELFGVQPPEQTSLSFRIIRKLLIFRERKNYRLICNLFLKFIQLFGIKILKEKGASQFSPLYLNCQSGIVYYFGFWQTPLYFQEIEDEIRTIYSFNANKLSAKSKELFPKIHAQESVSIHIRRGDFLSDANKSIYADICTFAYYSKAIAYISENVENPQFFIFSDDIEWAKKNLSLQNADYIDWNSGVNSWEDMFLISQCKHNIIANSTFSWWGAWLNKNPEKRVIAPSRFINTSKTPDIYPVDWIKMGNS